MHGALMVRQRANAARVEFNDKADTADTATHPSPPPIFKRELPLFQESSRGFFTGHSLAKI